MIKEFCNKCLCSDCTYECKSCDDCKCEKCERPMTEDEQNDYGWINPNEE